jgi:hypothetical protein
MAKNPFGKSRKKDEPYAIFAGDGPFGRTECRVLKTYQTPDKEMLNPYARWFVAVKTEYTYGSFDMGDSYIKEAKGLLPLVAATPEWLEAYPYYKQVPTPEQYIAAKLMESAE